MHQEHLSLFYCSLMTPFHDLKLTFKICLILRIIYFNGTAFIYVIIYVFLCAHISAVFKQAFKLNACLEFIKMN